MRLRTLARRRGAALLGALSLASLAFAAVPVQVADETRTGWFHVVWQTRGTANALADVSYFLVDERGRSTELSLAPGQTKAYGGALKLNGRRVTVSGDLRTAALPGAGAPVLRVSALRAEQGPRFAVSGAAQEGTRSYVTILCRFGDRTLNDPNPKSVYEQWMGAAYPGLQHYWAENSENRVSLVSTVVGPYVLPQPTASYMRSDGQADLAALARACTAAADADVNFSGYAGINMQFNADLGGYSWGGGWTLTLDGQTRRWATTWMADWATQSVYAHETGHSLGLPHSSGPYDKVYDSRWDVMSGGGSTDLDVGTRVATQTIALHKDLLGWIPAQRKYVAAEGTSTTLTLERGALTPAGGYQMVEVPIPGSSLFFTAEARLYAGYDAEGRLPGEAVVIHKVNYDDSSPARVVDPDGNGNPNDAGAMWTVGETFLDALAGVRISVVEKTATGFRVEVSTLGGIDVTSDSVLPNATMGAEYGAQLAAAGATGAVTWVVAAGTLPPGVTLSADGRLSGVPEHAGLWRFTVSAAGGGGFGVKEMRLGVGKPALAEAAVMDQLLATGALTADQLRFLDLLGNKNGHLDVGDVRAWLVDQGRIPGS